MGRDESQSRVAVAEIVDHPGPEELQALVDAREDDAAARYLRLQDYTSLVTAALRHDDALRRLDHALQSAPGR
jgi:hypothetical protein